MKVVIKSALLRSTDLVCFAVRKVGGKTLFLDFFSPVPQKVARIRGLNPFSQLLGRASPKGKEGDWMYLLCVAFKADQSDFFTASC